MKPEGQQERDSAVQRATAAQFTGEVGPDEAPAWEEVDTGRYMPRRIRGSYRGRALG
jgi:hypothetical protein